MTISIVSATPQVIFQGIQDNSTRELTRDPEVRPQHFPFTYTFAPKGPIDIAEPVVGDSLVSIFGQDTVDETSRWATHGTVLIKTLNEAANLQFLKRLKPDDAAGPATVRFVADVLATQVDEYELMPDGSLKLDANGRPIPTGEKIAGHLVKYIATQAVDAQGVANFGEATQTPGDQTDETTATQSIRIPLFDLRVPSFGSDGNNQGFRIWAPTQRSSDPIDTRILRNEFAYPFRMGFVRRANELSTSKAVNSLAGEQYMDLVFRDKVLNRSNGKQPISIHKRLISGYNDRGNASGLPNVYGPFDTLAVYDKNLDDLLKQLYAAEKPFIDEEFSDFDGVSELDYWRFNFISGVSSLGVPYKSFQIVTGEADSIRLTENATTWAAGGTDGTMTLETYNQLVAREVADWADETSPYQDDALYPVRIMYDTGFAFETKKALTAFIAKRKDTALVLCTHTVGEPALTASQETAMAISLRSLLRLYPESDLFGTPTVRGVVMGRSGPDMQSQYEYADNMPVVIELAEKAARMMGAGDGRWKPEFAFDTAEDGAGSILRRFAKVNVSFTPVRVRNTDWDAGLNWVQQYERRSLFWPALKTVYPDDTSVLNSFFTMLACCELEFLGAKAWRRFTGVSSLTDDQLVDRVNKYITDNVTGRFAGRFVIIADGQITDGDKQRGYSWTLPIKIYAPNMKTVETLRIEAWRMEDAPADAVTQ